MKKGDIALEDIELGTLLKKARKEKGFTLADIQERTKIRKKYLEAIEANNFDVLPGRVYLKVFVKGYAREVDINYDELLNYYPVLNIKEKNESSLHTDYLDGTKVPHKVKRKNNRKKSIFKIIFIVIISLFLIGAAVYTFQYFVNSEIRLLNQDVKEEQNIEQNALILENDAESSEEGTENNNEEVVEEELANLNNENNILNSIDPEILSDQNTEIINSDNFSDIEGINEIESDKITEIIASDNLIEEQNIAEENISDISSSSEKELNLDQNIENNDPAVDNDAPAANNDDSITNEEAEVNTPSETAENSTEDNQSQELDKSISFMASDTVWVNIRVNGETAFSGIMEAGDSREIELENRLYIKIGNAPAITALVEGEERGPWPGPAGIAEVEFIVEDNEIKINNLRENN